MVKNTITKLNTLILINMRERFIQFISDMFNPGQLYTRVEIVSAFENAKSEGIVIPNSENPTAFTYNRWNLGMTEILPLFEYLYYQAGDQKYKFLGLHFKYNGGVFHCPDNDIPQIQIATFKDGEYRFLGSGIKSLSDWKNNKNQWVQIVRSLSFVTTTMGETVRKYYIVDGPVDPKCNVTNGFGHVSIKSNLAKKMLFKKVGDKFEHGVHEYVITNIENS